MLVNDDNGLRTKMTNMDYAPALCETETNVNGQPPDGRTDHLKPQCLSPTTIGSGGIKTVLETFVTNRPTVKCTRCCMFCERLLFFIEFFLFTHAYQPRLIIKRFNTQKIDKRS